MKSHTVIILWVIAIVLGVTASIVKFGNRDDNATRTKLAPGDKIIPKLPIREITKVTLSKGKEITHLVRVSDEQWSVVERENYPANHELLRNLLGALGELEVTQGYPVSESHFGRFGLSAKAEESQGAGDNTDQGLLVTIIGKDQAIIERVYFGKYSGSSESEGRFIRIASDEAGVYAVGETFPGVTPSPADWLNKDFLKIDQIQSISLTAPSNQEFKPWQLVRQNQADGNANPNGQFILADMTDQELMVLTSTNQLRNLFSYSTFQDVLNKQDAASSAIPDQKLRRQATITTYDGFSYIIDFWPQKDKAQKPVADDRLPAVQPTYLLTVRVSADIPEKRTPGKDKSKQQPEVIEALNAEFEIKKAVLQEKLAAAQTLEGRIFQVSQSTISPLQKKRSDFVKTKDKTEAPQAERAAN